MAGAVASGIAGPKSRMSMPEQNPRPAPVITTAWTDVSADTAASVSLSSPTMT